MLGGGYCNTELRELSEPRVFDYFDFVTLDAGERPLLALIEHLQGKRPRERLVRTFMRDERALRRLHTEPDIAFAESGTPTYDGLPLNDYLSLLDMLNPMHRLWSRRPLEQADRRARLLLEEVQLLRREPRLHLALRPRDAPTCWSTGSRR